MKWLGMLPIESVRPNSWNVNVLPPAQYAVLKEGMRISGPERTEPITVRRAEDGALEMVDGEQRWRIARELGWRIIPAVEVEVDRKSAKLLCLSYNAVRGTVDTVKLSEMLLADTEMVEAASMVYGKEEVRRMIESAEKMSREAKQTLSRGVREKGLTLTTEVMRTIAEAPEEVQKLASEAVAMGDEKELLVQAIIERHMDEGRISEKKIEEGKGEGKRSEEGRGEGREGGGRKGEEEGADKKAEEARKRREEEGRVSIGGRAYEVASLVEIGEPGVYAIYYDAEKRKVGISVKKPTNSVNASL